MARFHCRLGEFLQVGREIRIHVTGRADEVLYVFIDASSKHELRCDGGFHASAPSGIRRSSHVLALRVGESFSIGPVAVVIEVVCLQIAGAQALRDVCLEMESSSPLAIVRKAWPRVRRKPRDAFGRLSCRA